MTSTLQIHLLGRFSACLDGRTLAGIATGRLQSLLAYLVLHSEAPQSRAHLAYTFWPDASESNSRNNLRQLLHQLRQALPEADRFVRADASSVQWDPGAPFTLDVALFERAVTGAAEAARGTDAGRRRECLERAIELCQGPLLPSCYDDWVGPERDRLQRRCKQAVADLVDLLEREREYGTAITHVRHWLEHDPLDEEAYRWLMRLQALAGDRVAALQAYRRCAEVLRRELAVEPSEETTRTYEQIRTAAGGRSPRHEPIAGPRLVGRESEWVRLRSAWERAAAGPPHFAIITGEAGVGKSRLAEELLTWARQQGLVAARTRSYAAEGRLSLGPVTEWLRSDALGPHLARLEEVWLVEVSRVLPELLAARPGIPRPAPMTEFGDRQRLFEALARSVLAAPPPLLLLIDDLQWCDTETLEWLHFLSRFDPAARVLVLATARSEDLAGAGPLGVLLRELEGASQLTAIALERLDAAETGKLAAQVANRSFDSEATTRLYRETEGNPLFVVETVRAGTTWATELFGSWRGAPFPACDGAPPPSRMDSGLSPRPMGSGLSGEEVEEAAELPPRVHAVIAGRLAQLSGPAREIAAAAAVLGRAFDLDVLQRVGGERTLIARALDELWQKRVVREQGPNTYDFTHDKLREVAYAETSAPQRRELHRRAAEAIEAVRAPDLDPVSAEIAAHYERAGLLAQAIPHYVKAAAVAQGVYANDEAVSLISRGLSLLRQLPASAKRDGWELELQLILAPIYRVTRGWASHALEEVLDRALALADTVGSSAQRAQVLYGMQSLYVVQARLEKVQLTTDEIARLHRQTMGTEPPLSAFAMLATAQLHLGRPREAVEQAEEFVRMSDSRQLQRLQESQGLNYRVIALASQSHALWCVGRPQSALERGLEAVRLAQDLAQPFNQAIAATYLALLQQLRADAATFRKQAEEALKMSVELDAPYYKAWAAILVAHAEASCRSDSPEPIGRLREAIEDFKKAGARLRLPYYLALLAEGFLRAGEAEAGLEVIEEALAAARETSERWWDAELHRLRSELMMAGGADPEEGEAALKRSLDIARAQGAKSLELRAALSLSRLWSGTGRSAEAKKLLGPLLASFIEGFDTPDLLTAGALVAALG